MAAGVEDALPTQRSSLGPSATAGHASPVLSLGLLDAKYFEASAVTTQRMVQILETYQPMAPAFISETLMELVLFLFRISALEMIDVSTRLKCLKSHELAFLRDY
eukprot:11109277-Karenia_brevis.AAC.1